MNKKYFYAMFGRDYHIGNLSEDIFYTLLKAKREDKRVVFVRKHILFRSFMLKALRLRQPNAIYNIRSNFIKNNNTILANLIAFYGGLYIFVSYLYETIRYKSEKKIKQAFSLDVSQCKFYPALPSIGTNDIYNLQNATSFKFSETDKAYWHNAISTKFEINLDEKINDQCKKFSIALDIDKFPWYVCLHVRTPMFHNSTADLFRNSNIENYYDAIRYIISLGGAVIRMGDPMPYVEHIEGFINYPNSPEKSEEMDLFLIKNCKFFIGTTSGIHDTALLFGVPLLSVNTNDYIFVKPYKECDSYIYKHIFSKEKNRILTFKEVLDEPFFIHSNLEVASDMKKLNDNYEFIENSAEDILTSVRNMIYSLDNNSYPRNDAQMKFKYHLNSSVMEWIDTEEWFKKNVEGTYKVFSKEQYHGSIDKDFAEKYYGE